MKSYKSLFAIGFSLLPLLVAAQGIITEAGNIVQGLQGLVNIIFPLLIGVAAIVFVWGIIKYIMAAGDEKARKDGRMMIIWSLVGLAVILGMAGLVNLLLSTVGQTGGGAIPRPSI